MKILLVKSIPHLLMERIEIIMANNNLGAEIIKAFLEGVTGADMSELRDSINNTADSVIEDVRQAAKMAPKNLSSHKENYSQGSYTRMRQENLYKEREDARKRQAEEAKVVKANSNTLKKNGTKVTELGFPMVRVGSTSSTVYTVAGGVGLGVSMISLFGSLFGYMFGSASISKVILMGVFSVIFAVVLETGVHRSKTLSLADRYADYIGKREYVEIKELAGFIGKSEKKTIKEIKKMIGKGFFPQGHLDDKDQNLILTDNVYKQYIETRKNAAAMNTIDTTARVVDENEDNLSEEEKTELRLMIKEGNEYVEQLHELNSRIPGEVITKKLDRLELILRDIFVRVKDHPEQMSKMHELMEYYLPTMIKLVSAYEEYDKVSDPGKDIIEAKDDIEATLDTINDAFKKLLNNLFKESVWDVTTDAQVLKTVLAQKGLTNNN